jgi:hypothetical protein
MKLTLLDEGHRLECRSVSLDVDSIESIRETERRVDVGYARACLITMKSGDKVIVYDSSRTVMEEWQRRKDERPSEE